MGLDYFTLNTPSVPGDKSAAYLDGSATPKKHQLIILETQLGAADPQIVNTGNPLPTQGFGVYKATLPTLTDGNISPILLDSSGRPQVNLAAGGAQVVADNGSVFTIGATQGLPGAFIVGSGAAAPTAGNLGLACMTLNRQQRMVLDVDTQGGLTVVPYIAPATAAAFLVKGSRGQVVWLDAENEGAIPVKLKWFNAATAGAVTLGTTAAVFETSIPCNVNGAGRSWNVPTGLDMFPLGIVIAVTAAFGLTDNTSTGLVANKIGLTIGIK